jgi:hypothetical protein
MIKKKLGPTKKMTNQMLAKLHLSVEKAKIELSSKAEAVVQLDGMAEPFVEIISREKFEELAKDLFSTISSKANFPSSILLLLLFFFFYFFFFFFFFFCFFFFFFFFFFCFFFLLLSSFFFLLLLFATSSPPVTQPPS